MGKEALKGSYSCFPSNAPWWFHWTSIIVWVCCKPGMCLVDIMGPHSLTALDTKHSLIMQWLLKHSCVLSDRRIKTEETNSVYGNPRSLRKGDAFCIKSWRKSRSLPGEKDGVRFSQGIWCSKNTKLGVSPGGLIKTAEAREENPSDWLSRASHVSLSLRDDWEPTKVCPGTTIKSQRSRG